MNMKSITNVAIVIGISLAAGVSLADDTNSPAQSSLLPPVTASDFTWNASVANLKEIRLAEFAEQTSTNDDVKTFAKKMIHDHSTANRRLTKMAMKDNFNLPDTNAFYIVVNDDQPIKQATQLITHETPESALKDQQIAAQQVEGFNGQAFDQAYAAAMVKDHADAIQLFENASENVTNEDLKRFATKMLPTLHHHYEMAQMLQTNVGDMQATNMPGAGSATNSMPVSPTVGM